MKLRRYVDDGGYYLVGPLGQQRTPLTLQVGQSALIKLQKRGYGPEVSIPEDLIRELSTEGFVWRKGEHPLGPATEPELLARVVPPEVLEKLVAWAQHGVPQQLFDGKKITPGSCFPDSFLNWLACWEIVDSLADYRGVHLTDFEAMAGTKPKCLPPLHTELLDRDDGVPVLWRFARLAARATAQTEQSPTCPTEWDGQCMGFIFHRILDWQRKHSPTVAGRHIQGLQPSVWWEVEERRIVALLPGGPANDRHRLTWTVNGENQPPPAVDYRDGGARRPAAVSGPIPPPSAEYPNIEITVSDEVSRESSRHTFPLPANCSPFVLFSAQGELIPVDQPLHPGNYLALAMDKPDFPTLAGVEVSGRVEREPAGWWNWWGYRIRILPDADPAPYRVSSELFAELRFADEPENGVQFLGPLPVWIDGWPSVIVEWSAEAMRRSLQLVVSSGGCPKHRATLEANEFAGGAGKFPLPREGQVSLAELDGMRGWEGPIDVELRSPFFLEAREPVLRFIRTEDVGLSYAPDPLHPDHALAVRLQGRKIIVESDTTIQHGDLLCARNPREVPEVGFRTENGACALRIRIPATRVARISGAARVPHWVAPPMEIGLSGIGPDDELLVDLHHPPETEGGCLLCRLEGRGLVAAGGKHRGIAAFEVPLQSWRDAFGAHSRGPVQARTEAGWVDIAVLVSDEAAAVQTEPSSPLTDLEEAFLGGDFERVRELAAVHERAADAPGMGVARREDLLVRVAKILIWLGEFVRAGSVLGRLGSAASLRDCGLLRLAARVRGIETPDAGQQVLAGEISGFPETSLRFLLHGEISYRLCDPGHPKALAQTWRHYAGRMTGGCAIEMSEALLVEGIVAFLSNTELQDAALQPYPYARHWRDTVRRALNYLNKPLGKHPRGPLPAKRPVPPMAWRKTDGDLLELVTLQAGGYVSQSAALLQAGSPDVWRHFFAWDLIQARQLRFKGEREKARTRYFEVIESGRHGAAFALDEINAL